jgi:hypothetical protein
MFLMGSYMIMEDGWDAEGVWNSIKRYKQFSKENSTSTLDLNLLDLWRGIEHAKQLGWTDVVSVGNNSQNDIYFHKIVPGKLAAFGGAKSDCTDVRSVAFYASEISKMNVKSVVRLNDRDYEDREFERLGMQCVCLEFEGSTLPSSVVSAFLLTMRSSARNLVMVRRDSGRAGRTGSGLCALYLMHIHGFAAREAVAWMHLTTPLNLGVFKPSLGYLTAVETVFKDIMSPPPMDNMPPCSPLPTAAGARARPCSSPLPMSPQRGRSLYARDDVPQLALGTDSAPGSPLMRGGGGDAAGEERRRANAFNRALQRVWVTYQNSESPSRRRPQSPLHNRNDRRLSRFAATSPRAEGAAACCGVSACGVGGGGGDGAAALGCLAWPLSGAQGGALQVAARVASRRCCDLLVPPCGAGESSGKDFTPTAAKSSPVSSPLLPVSMRSPRHFRPSF